MVFLLRLLNGKVGSKTIFYSRTRLNDTACAPKTDKPAEFARQQVPGATALLVELALLDLERDQVLRVRLRVVVTQKDAGVLDAVHRRIEELEAVGLNSA
jgi:hypothetical protein